LSGIAVDDEMAASLLLLVSSSSNAALFLLLWEILITLDQEVEYIWVKPCTAWIKWVFLFARYFPLAIQICNRGIELAIFKQYPLSVNAVRIWHSCQVLVALIVLMPGEVVLMARVYALYNQARWIFNFFSVILVAETVVVVLGFVLTMPQNYELRAFITDMPHSFAYFGIAMLVTQVTILVLSAVKYFRGRWGTAQAAPLVKLLVRDGTMAFVAVSSLSLMLMIYAFIGTHWAATEYAWFVTFLSVTECRIIINMQTLPASRDVRSDSTELQNFTSVFPRGPTSFYDTFPSTHRTMPLRCDDPHDPDQSQSGQQNIV